MFRTKAFWIAGLILIFILGGAYLLYHYQQSQTVTENNAPNLQTAVARRGDLLIFASGVGELVPANEVGIGFSESGILTEILVNVGDQVSKDQILARMNTSKTEGSISSSIAEAELSVITAQQELDNLYSNASTTRAQTMQDIITYSEELRDAQYQLDNYTIPLSQNGMDAIQALDFTGEQLEKARQEFEPYKFLPASNPVRQDLLERLNTAQSEYNSAVKRLEYEYQVEVSQVNLDKARQDYEKYNHGPNTDDIKLAEAKLVSAEAKLVLAQESKEVEELLSPIDSTVLSISSNVGENISNNTIMTLGDLSQKVLSVYLDETDVDKVAIGNEAEIVFDALPDQVFKGAVIAMEPSLVDVSNVKAVSILVQIDDESIKNQSLIAGLNATVDVISGRAQNSVLIPLEALRELGDDEYAVFVLQNDQPKLRIVIIGLMDYTTVEIIDGLQPGEIVTTGIIDTE